MFPFPFSPMCIPNIYDYLLYITLSEIISAIPQVPPVERNIKRSWGPPAALVESCILS